MKKFLAILFILLGVGLLTYTPLRELYDEYEKNKLIEMYEKNNSDTDGDSNLQGSESEEENISDFYEYFSGLQTIVENRNSSESAGTNGDGTTGTNGEDNTEKKLKNVIGIISIDKINVKLPIKNYFKEEEIWSSVGHIPGTANPGETGNCVIAGHRARAKGRLFNRLDELELGDTISITYNSNNFEYKVSEIKIVEPTDVSVLNSDKDEVSLTLITCHPVRVLSHRLIIKAILIP